MNDLHSLALWYLEKVPGFPRSHRFTLGERMETCLLDLLEAAVEAAYSRDKTPHLDLINRRLHRLRILTRLATDLKVLSLDQQGHAAVRIDEIGRQVGGWRKAKSDGKGRDA